MAFAPDPKPYKPGDKLVNAADQKYVVVDVLPHSVLLATPDGLGWFTKNFLRTGALLQHVPADEAEEKEV